MEKGIFIIKISDMSEKLKSIVEKLQSGWQLDPMFKHNPIILDTAAIYHLVKYSEAENGIMLKAMDQQKPGKYDDVIDVKSVIHNEVAGLVAAGWTVHDMLSKTTTLIMRKKKETKHALVIPLEAVHLKKNNDKTVPKSKALRVHTLSKKKKNKKVVNS